MIEQASTVASQSARPRRAAMRKARRALDALNSCEISLSVPGKAAIDRARARACSYIEHAIDSQGSDVAGIPVIALIGSSGVGKSTLANALTSSSQARVCLLRPGTTFPLAFVHPLDIDRANAHPRLLSVRVCAANSAPRSVVLVDTPPLDYGNPELLSRAYELLEAADVAIFVTTPYRYADAAPWDVLARIADKGIALGAVVNRIPAHSDGSSLEDFKRLWASAGFSRSPVFAINECADGQELIVAPHREDSLGSAISEDMSPRAERQRRGRHASQLLHSQSLPDGDMPATRLRRRVRTASRRGGSAPEGVQGVYEWIVEYAKCERPARRGASSSRAFRDFLADVDLVADSLDEVRNTLIDISDRAAEGAAVPFEKLSTNIEMGRFGQGSASALWSMLLQDEQIQEAGDINRKSTFPWRDHSRCDGELMVLYETVIASVTMALTQGIATAVINIDTAWEEGYSGLLSDLVDAAHERISVSEIAGNTAAKWRNDVIDVARDLCTDTRFEIQGWAALIGVAASGVSGAMKVARDLGFDSHVRQARSALRGRVHEGLTELVDIYTADLANMQLEDSGALRAAIDDFACVMEGCETSW